jgi:putative hemolysin
MEQKVKAMAEKIIDIDAFLKVRKESRLSLKKLLSGLIKKYVRENELNEILSASIDRQGAEWAQGILESLNISVTVKGEENLARPGRYVIVGNHPLGGIDGLAVIAGFHEHFPRIRSLSHDLLRIIPNTQPIIVPINTKSMNSREAVKAIDALFGSDDQVLIFPAGVVSRRKGGTITDIAWQKTFLTKAYVFERDIIPVNVEAENSPGFYFFSLIRRVIQKITGIRLEIFSIVRESLNQKNKSINLTVGKPISWRVFTPRYSFKSWAQLVREHVYVLKNNPGAQFGEEPAENNGL